MSTAPTPDALLKHALATLDVAALERALADGADPNQDVSVGHPALAWALFRAKSKRSDDEISWNRTPAQNTAQTLARWAMAERLLEAGADVHTVWQPDASEPPRPLFWDVAQDLITAGCVVPQSFEAAIPTERMLAHLMCWLRLGADPCVTSVAGTSATLPLSDEVAMDEDADGHVLHKVDRWLCFVMNDDQVELSAEANRWLHQVVVAWMTYGFPYEGVVQQVEHLGQTDPVLRHLGMMLGAHAWDVPDVPELEALTQVAEEGRAAYDARVLQSTLKASTPTAKARLRM